MSVSSNDSDAGCAASDVSTDCSAQSQQEPAGHAGCSAEASHSAAGALFRALAPVNHVSTTVFSGKRDSSVASALAWSQEKSRGCKRKREAMLLSDKERLGRTYLVARRLAGRKRGWAEEWARENHPERCSNAASLARFLRQCRRAASSYSGKTEPGLEPSRGSARLQQHGSILGLGT